jgi:hypothetical protein
MAPLPPTPTSALDPNARQMLEQQFDETVGRDLPDADPATRKKAFSQYVTHFTKFFNQYQTVTAPQPVAGIPGMPVQAGGHYLQQVPMQVPLQGGYAVGMPQPLPLQQQVLGAPSGVPQYSPQPMQAAVPSAVVQYSPQPLQGVGGLPG